MAIKVALAAALLVALVAMAGATTYTTTITVDNDGQQQCREQVQRRQFRACQRFLQQPRNDEEEIEMRSVSPRRVQEECCESLKEMENQGCECEAIRHAAMQVQQMGGQRQMGQVYQRAQQLPQICRLRTQQCRLQVVFV